jgi:hypothetical protein
MSEKRCVVLAAWLTEVALLVGACSTGAGQSDGSAGTGSGSAGSTAGGPLGDDPKNLVNCANAANSLCPRTLGANP